jgi:hypothetical protein
MNEQIKNIYEEDQNDRKIWEETGDSGNVKEKDELRRQMVQQMIDSGQLEEGADYYHAAMVFQHGDRPEDFLKSNELAKKAIELGEERGKWMFAASYDRYLTNTKAEFQKYGTQYKKDKDADSWYVYPIDPNTTDEERAKYNVPPLEGIYKILEELNSEDKS